MYMLKILNWKMFGEKLGKSHGILSLLHSKSPKLYTVLAFQNAKGLKWRMNTPEHLTFFTETTWIVFSVRRRMQTCQGHRHDPSG